MPKFNPSAHPPPSASHPSLAPHAVLDREKDAFRALARARRRAARQGAPADAAERLADRFEGAMAEMGLDRPSTVSGFWPLKDEIDLRPLLDRLHGQGWTCALPVVTGRDRPLVFREWSPGDGLEEGGFATRHPRRSQPEITPHVVLVPLLAFDVRGFRVGYGGGYYDRTLEALRRAGPVIAAGAAFAGQQMDDVPHGQYDQPLDWVVTEAMAMKVSP